MILRRALLLPVLVLAGAASVFGCPRPPPPPPEVAPPPPPAFQVPPGCEQDLSGHYAYEGREDWTYQATDDGEALLLAVSRAPVDGDAPVPANDAGLAPDSGTVPTSSTVSISLMRTPRGFVGGIEHSAFPAPGVECRVVFPTEVLACDAQGLTLRSVETVAVDQSCQTPPADGGVAQQTHRLVRVAPPAG